MRYDRKLDKYTSDLGIIYPDRTQKLLRANINEFFAIHYNLLRVILPVIILIFPVFVLIMKFPSFIKECYKDGAYELSSIWKTLKTLYL